MKASDLSLLANTISRIAEQNISNIEKVHSRIRLSRFVSLNLFLIVGVFIILGSIVALTINVWMSGSILIVFFGVLLLSINILSKSNKLDITLKKGYIFLIMIILIVILIGYMLLDNIMKFNVLKLESYIGTVMSALLFLLLSYSLIYASKNVSELVIQRFLPNYIIIIRLSNGETLTGSLVTITKKNDYIMKTNIHENEILIKNSAIVTLQIEQLIDS